MTRKAFLACREVGWGVDSPPPLIHCHTQKWCPTLGHLIVQIQPLEVAIEHKAMDVTVQGEICFPAISVHPHIVPAQVVKDAASTHRGVTRSWLDGAAA